MRSAWNHGLGVRLVDKRRVLLIGDDTRSFLATLRSLGRQGIEVHVAPYDLGAPALRSKYVSHVHRLPYYLDGGERWLAALEAACTKQKFDLIIPCEERALLPLYRVRDPRIGRCGRCSNSARPAAERG